MELSSKNNNLCYYFILANEVLGISTFSVYIIWLFCQQVGNLLRILTMLGPSHKAYGRKIGAEGSLQYRVMPIC